VGSRPCRGAVAATAAGCACAAPACLPPPPARPPGHPQLQASAHVYDNAAAAASAAAAAPQLERVTEFDAQGKALPRAAAAAPGLATDDFDAFGWEQFEGMMQAEGLDGGRGAAGAAAAAEELVGARGSCLRRGE